MTTIDRAYIAGKFAEGDAARTKAARGRALEDVLVHIFSAIPGIESWERDVQNGSRSEEIDIVFWNKRSDDGLYFVEHTLLVECKNWREPVGSAQLREFDHKLANRAQDLGIFVAASGITGTATAVTQAHRVVEQALSHKRYLVVFTRSEIESLRDGLDLVHRIKQKVAQIVASGTIYGVSASSRRPPRRPRDGVQA